MQQSAIKCENNTCVATTPAEAVAAADEFILDEIYETFELIRSYAVSGIEAARRGDREEIKLRLRVQLRDCFRHAVQVHDLLSSGGGDAA
jgi:hypothetical protein